MKLICKSLFSTLAKQIEDAEARCRTPEAVLLTQAEMEELKAELPDLRMAAMFRPGLTDYPVGSTIDVPLKDGTRWRLLSNMKLLGVDVYVIPAEIVGKLK